MEKTANEKPIDNGPTDEQPKEQALSLISIIMAAGLGKRMSSDKAKVLHEVAGKPMLYHVIRNAIAIGSEKILIVVGKYKQDIISAMASL